MPPLFSDGNPVLRRELFNVLRSRKSFVLLFLYAAALTGIVYVAWPPAGEPRAVQSEKTRILFNVFARGQMVMIAMLAPAFSAGCMTVEKERRSLDLLLTTPLRGGAVLWGKYLASAAYLVLLTAATAPMVASFLYLPGLDPEEVAGLYLFLLAESCCFGMVGLTASVFLPRTQAALSIAYLAILPASAILLLVSLAFPRFFHVGAAVWPSAIMATAALSMYVACRSRMARPFDPVPKSWDEEDVSSQSGLVLVRDRFPDRLLLPSRRDELMEDGTDPVLYKEMRCEVFGRGTLFLRLIIQVSMFMAVVFLTFLYMGYE
ncbi:MAG: ABC transporter permease, partial [Planctomycetota bacterium]|nr:ABC transporter permease [Planctomycetota bacterium]